ncbi:hypothetical protein LSM04_005577 [Trypanosoma melophagium]|uniref:uncharacterized protein n=1 Tax=Trypanosoma melophagium TaxID=715481 RepID=UPI003519F918|nr:hypothetical protein LSM04_001354 [Trypanosoma melophagium]KAH9597215.1 hypothetical protein LSM04_005577 [Trypanosoma melophagium]
MVPYGLLERRWCSRDWYGLLQHLLSVRRFFFFFSTWGNWCLLDTVGTVFMLTRTLITIVPTYNASHVDFPEEKLRVGMTGVLSRHLFECSTEIDLVL